jgi:pyruvate kinase
MTWKVMATVGPSSSSPSVWRDLKDAGVGAVRIPGSKYALDEITALCSELHETLGQIPIYVDLPGDKHRFANTNVLRLSEGVTYTLTTRANAAAANSLPVDSIPRVTQCSQIIVGDGSATLIVVDTSGGEVVVRPTADSVVRIRQGFSVAGAYSHSTPTTQDIKLATALQPDLVQGVLLSFAESRTQVSALQELISISVVPKIETREGIRALSDIGIGFHVVMLGRGDLLLDTGAESYGSWEMRAVQESRRLGISLILGTELLTQTSMHSVGHRSELAYLSCMSQYSGIRFMLSDETSVGPRPVEMVALLASIAHGGTTEPHANG